MIVENLGLENVKIILKKLSQESFIQDWKPGYLMGIFFFFWRKWEKLFDVTCLACYDMRECYVT